LTKIVNFISRLLNIDNTEFFSVGISWVLSFLIRLSQVISFTILIVFFAVNYGILSLPYLFILHSIGVIAGSIIFGRFISQYSKENWLISFGLATSICSVLSAFFYNINQVVFLVFLFIAVSVLLGQLKIIRMLFTEEQFTPVQSHRVLPVIESAENIGIIFGGFIFSTFGYVLSLNKFMYILAIAACLIVPVVFWSSRYSVSVKFNPHHLDSIKVAKYSVFKKIIANKFVVALIIVVLLQWAFISILDFQYTKAIDAAAHSIENTVNYASTLAQDLGMIQGYIGLFALVFQLFIASRFMSLLGISGSFLVYPIVMIASLFSMVLNYGIVTAVTTKFTQEISNVLHLNAYHSSYYALKHKYRLFVAELIEGFVRPSGAILGTLIILFITYFFNNSDFLLSTSAIILLVIMLLVTYLLAGHYKNIPRNTLLNSTSVFELMNTIDLIAQNYSESDLEFLFSYLLKNRDLQTEVVEKIFNYFATYADFDDLQELILYIENTNFINTVSVNSLNKILLKNYNEIVLNPKKLNSYKPFVKSLYKTDLMNEELRDSIDCLYITLSFYLSDIKTVLEISKVNNSSVVKQNIIQLYKFSSDKKFLNIVSPTFKKLNSDLVDLEFYYNYLSAAEFSLMLKKTLAGSSILNLEIALYFILKQNMHLEYLNEIRLINIGKLKEANVNLYCSLVNSIVNPSEDFVASLERLNIKEFVLIYSKLSIVGGKNLNIILQRRAEYFIDFLTSNISKVKITESDLDLLHKLYSLLGIEHEYFMIMEYLSLDVA
jgi:MFS family permease